MSGFGRWKNKYTAFERNPSAVSEVKPGWLQTKAPAQAMFFQPCPHTMNFSNSRSISSHPLEDSAPNRTETPPSALIDVPATAEHSSEIVDTLADEDPVLKEQVAEVQKLADGGHTITITLILSKLKLSGHNAALRIHQAWTEQNCRDEQAKTAADEQFNEPSGDLEARRDADSAQGDRDLGALSVISQVTQTEAEQTNEAGTADGACQVIRVAPAQLSPHPLHEQLYGNTPNDTLKRSIEEFGVLTPLLVRPDNVILSGKSRWECAVELGIREVPVRVLTVTDEIRTEEFILETNHSREKNIEQKLKEYGAYRRIETAKAKVRAGQRNDLRTNLPAGSSGRARDIAAEKTGFKSSTAEKGLKIIQAIDTLETEEDAENANKLRQKLSESIDSAFILAKQEGWIASSKKYVSSDVGETMQRKKTPTASSAPEETEMPPLNPEVPHVEGSESERGSDPEEPGFEEASLTPSFESRMEEPSFPTVQHGAEEPHWEPLLSTEVIEERLARPSSRANISLTYRVVFTDCVALVNRLAGCPPTESAIDDIREAVTELNDLIT